jgi:hypothetical protein
MTLMMHRIDKKCEKTQLANTQITCVMVNLVQSIKMRFVISTHRWEKMYGFAATLFDYD